MAICAGLFILDNCLSDCNYSYKGFNLKCGYRPITLNIAKSKEELEKYLNCNVVTFFECLRQKANIARHNFKGTVTGGITERIVAAQQKVANSEMMKNELLS